MKRATATTKRADTATYAFKTRDEAWRFMRACDAQGIPAGFPGLVEYTVDVSLDSWRDRDRTDTLAGAEPIGYRFGIRGFRR